jgi:DNA-binding NtrC family response regulator
LDITLDQPLKQILDRVLLAALELEEGNRSRVARRLGISLRTVQRHLEHIQTQS